MHIETGYQITSAPQCYRQSLNSSGVKSRRGNGSWCWGAFVVALSCASAAPLADGASAISGFAAGQEWSVKAPPESPAKIIIGRVEPWRDRVAVHVSIVDIPASQETGALHVREIAHIPFEESALAASVDKLLATGVSPSRDFDTGYRQWKEHNGGIFTVPLAEATTLNK